MSPFCSAHQPPRAGVDPVDSAAAALAVIRLAMHRPARSETIAVVLGDDQRGRSIVVVDGTDDPDAVVAVVERLADTIAVSGRDGALVRGLDPTGPRSRCPATSTAGWRPATSPTAPASTSWSGSSSTATSAWAPRGARATCSVNRRDGRRAC